MKKWFRILGLVLLLVLLVVQFFPGQKPATVASNPDDIHNEVLIPAEVSGFLKSACYDCHSNETRYPWYASVAPVSWLVIHDTEEGREELNFSEWITFTEKRKHHKLEELIEELEEGKMPLPVYTLTHWDAKLTDEQKEALITWAKGYMSQLNPGD